MFEDDSFNKRNKNFKLYTKYAYFHDMRDRKQTQKPKETHHRWYPHGHNLAMVVYLQVHACFLNPPWYKSALSFRKGTLRCPTACSQDQTYFLPPSVYSDIQ